MTLRGRYERRRGVGVFRKERLGRMVPPARPARLRAWVVRVVGNVVVDDYVGPSSWPGHDVPYGPAAAALGIDGYLMAENDRDVHGTEQTRLKEILTSDLVVNAHRAALAASVEFVRMSLDSIDAVDLGAVLDEAVHRWAASLLGVADHPQLEYLGAVADAIVDRTYFETEFFNSHTSHRATQAVETVQAFDAAIQSTPPSSALWDSLKTSAGESAARRDLIGLLGGPRMLTSVAAIEVLRSTWRFPKRWQAMHQLAKGTDSGAYHEAIRHAIDKFPPVFALPRIHQPSAGSSCRHVAISTQTFWGKGSAFGLPDHPCLGQAMATEAIAELLRPMFERRRPQLIQRLPSHRRIIHRRGHETVPRSFPVRWVRWDWRLWTYIRRVFVRHYPWLDRWPGFRDRPIH